MHKKITTACETVNVQSTTNTNDGDGVFEKAHAHTPTKEGDKEEVNFIASESEVFVNSSTSSQNTNNVDATDVDADEPHATTCEFNPEDMAITDGGSSPSTFDSPVLLSVNNTNTLVQVGEVTNDGGDESTDLSQLLDMMSKMKQQLHNVQAENDGLKQRLTAEESSNSLLQQRCSIVERQYSRLMMHHLVTGDRASTVTPPSKHIIKPQLITFGKGKILSTVGIDAVDRRLISGTKRRHSS